MIHKVVRIELSAIYIAAALLFVSVAGLVGNVTAAGAREPYPGLYYQPAGASVPPRQKTVYFTFDDGPSKNTEKILDVLKEQDVKATFFVTGQNADEPYAAEMLGRMVAEGHSIGLHSYSHQFYQIYASADSYLADLDRLNSYLVETVGVRSGILRFPGGSATVNASPSTMKELIAELTRRGYQYYDWDVVSGDDTEVVYDPEYLAERMVGGAGDRETVVVLLHDSPAPVTTAKAVEIAIGRFWELGYTFDRLTEEVEPVHIKTSRLD